ncbi:nitrilase-related carbon-nitrogen hydrolase [Roseicitreum antarcticum]|uniref:Predicted amidohydrolase n=1 Tax=Roseicitreum antarcticum TaxID=564137 RepID=A0A1H2Z575_9RHOB|nr:nitrilase-related carbon-nitrogen hydrolase [Roseicitreum antarcticum]SDX12560.1 Predicted amidohydrolase [Roseicitreum antarcticum]
MTVFAAIQMCSTADVVQNNRTIAALMREAAAQGAQVVSLPEAANILLKDQMDYPRLCQDEGADTTLALCRQLADELGIWVHTGSLLVRTPNGDRVWNRSHVISPAGQVTARYDKIHTFDVALGGAGDFIESRAVAPGEAGAVICTAAGHCLGLSICYDLRFPYLFRALAAAGAGVLMIPASFSPITGPLHWETLLRARAIETGSYVVAAAQCGIRDGVATYGQSRIISPMGEILAATGDAPGVILAQIDAAEVARTRARLPVLSQTREIGEVTHAN